MALKTQILIRSTRVSPAEKCAELDDIEIRNLEGNDVESLGQLLFSSFRNTVHGDCWTSQNAATYDAASLLISKSSSVFWTSSYIAFSKGVGVGTTVVVDSRVAPLLFYCCTHPDFEGRGLARTLIIRSLRSLHQSGMIDLCLNVADLNLRAFSLYRRMGFVPLNRTIGKDGTRHVSF